MTPTPVSLIKRLAALDLLAGRTPEHEDAVQPEADLRWLDKLSNYRDGGIFIAHFGGESAWERHGADEVVMVLDGQTTLSLIVDGATVELSMSAMQLVVVPADTWHRFHAPDRVQIMTITPQPTEHTVEDPLAP